MEGKRGPSAKNALASKNQKVVVRKGSNKVFGIFIDGVGLDRASRRMQRKVNMAALVKGLTTGSPALLARYYTLLPQEDDSRHRAFLDAIASAGLEVFSKRLPPKGIERQIAVDVEMAADMISFALGREDSAMASMISASGQFSIQSQRKPGSTLQNSALQSSETKIKTSKIISPHPALNLEEWANLKNQPEQELEEQVEGDNLAEISTDLVNKESCPDSKRVIVVVCPSRELSYPLALCKFFGADTISADFGKFTSGDLLKSAAKWIDLSDSKTIWK